MAYIPQNPCVFSVHIGIFIGNSLLVGIVQIGISDIAVFKKSLLLFCHKYLQKRSHVTVYDIGNAVLYTAFLKSGIYYIAHIVGQRQLYHGFAKKENYTQKRKQRI